MLKDVITSKLENNLICLKERHPYIYQILQRPSGPSPQYCFEISLSVWDILSCVWLRVLLFFRFLFEVQQHSKVNKMNVENLATVMGINLLKPQIEDPITVMKGEDTQLTDVPVLVHLKRPRFQLCFC